MPPNSLPEGVPLSYVQSLLAQVLPAEPKVPNEPGPRPSTAPMGSTVPGAGTEPGGPVGAPPMGGPSGGPPPSPLPPHPSANPPGGPPLPGEKDSGEGEGLSPDQQSMLMQLLADPRAQRDALKILDQLGGRAAKTTPLEVVSPEEADALAEYLNSAIDDLTENLTVQRGISPGANEASDEQLLIVYYTTPADLTLDDIPAYANTVRMYLQGKGWTDIDDIEDQVIQECFPLRLSLIRNGRQQWRDQVAFVDSMEALSERWIARYGKLPQPDRLVQVATEAGGGDPGGQYYDEKSEALPQGEQPR